MKSRRRVKLHRWALLCALEAMELFTLGLFGLIVGIVIGILGAYAVQRFNLIRDEAAESNEERIEIETTDHRKFTGRFHHARLTADGNTMEWDHVHSIGNNAYGIYFNLAEGKLQYSYEQVDGEVAITMTGVSDPIVIQLNKVDSLWRRKLDRNA